MSCFQIKSSLIPAYPLSCTKYIQSVCLCVYVSFTVLSSLASHFQPIPHSDLLLSWGFSDLSSPLHKLLFLFLKDRFLSSISFRLLLRSILNCYPVFARNRSSFELLPCYHSVKQWLQLGACTQVAKYIWVEEK